MVAGRRNGDRPIAAGGAVALGALHSGHTFAHGNLGPQRCQCKAPHAVPTKSSQESTLALRTTPDDNEKRDCRAGNHSQNLKLHQVPEGLRDAARDLVFAEIPVQKRNIAQGSLSRVLPCALALAHKTDLQGHDNHTGISQERAKMPIAKCVKATY